MENKGRSQKIKQRTGWQYVDRTLHCDGFPLKELRLRLRSDYGYLGSPAYIYSSNILKENTRRYTDALQPLGDRGILSYSMKAYGNPHILKVLRENGVEALTTVSGNEILLGLKCGFQPERIIFNGNGKRRWELELAIRRGVLLNIDSVFDAHQIVSLSRQLDMTAKALLRLNPAIAADTHPYLATALADSKFGVEMQQVDQVLKIARETFINKNGSPGEQPRRFVDILGVHIHIGSAISNIEIYSEMMTAATQTLERIKDSGWPDASMINLGGGLNIELSTPGAGALEKSIREVETPTSDHSCPTPQQLIASVLPLMPVDSTLILEPGRSLVATAGVILSDVIGVKRNGEKEYVVVDAAMTEIIRPALYGAIHPVTYVTLPAHEEVAEYDVVGPVCESGDFIHRQCLLPRPKIQIPSKSSSSYESSLEFKSKQIPSNSSSSFAFESSLEFKSNQDVNNLVLNDVSSSPNSHEYSYSSMGDAIVVWTAGAYCSSMSSNYNLRPRVIEVLVTGPEDYQVIRKPQSFEDLIQCYQLSSEEN